ncbi:MAG: DNA alkylation repair protein [Myxococcota bacterium]
MKHHLGPDAVRWLAGALELGEPFVADALAGLDALELTPRGRHVAAAMARHLPRDFVAAAAIVERALGPVEPGVPGLSSFRFLPVSFWVAEAGLADFEAAMRLQHALTQRFTAEFSVRAWLRADPARTMARLAEWTRDPSEHVRRLVSEGTRPRLPWAPRLPGLDAVPLLDALVGDPSLYVRRSVANHLGDVAKDDPDRAVAVARRWGHPWITRHGLRWLVKQGHPGALALLGARGAEVEVSGDVRVDGDDAHLAVEITSRAQQRLVVDYVVAFPGARGPRTKVFKLTTVDAAAGQVLSLSAKVSLRPMTTRPRYPGEHAVAARVNGVDFPVGTFVA